MKLPTLRVLCIAGALSAFCSIGLRAETIEFRATINAAQETTASASPATGWAVLLYDVVSNQFDLTVTINDLTNTITASHIHEAAMGVPGPVVTDLGSEIWYTRSGTTVTATFTGKTHGGTKLKLLQNGAYLNFHSATYPGGEIRGQLIAQPKRLTAILNAAQEFPVTNSTAYGAAYISYNPGTNKITTRINLYNFTNTLTNSHYHEGVRGVPGPVVHGFGGASVYTKTGASAYGAVFADQTYLGDPVKLLTGGAYLNVHSNISPPGEIRGQVIASDELEVPRLLAMAARGFVGTGEQVLINGFVVTGGAPVRVLITARGPSLAPLGVASPLANPMIAVYDSAGRAIVSNDDMATTFSAADLPSTGFAPTNASESALLLVLPPGPYTTIVSGVGNGTGVALTEVYEVRAGSAAPTLAQTSIIRGQRRLVPAMQPASDIATGTRVLEFCGGEGLAIATVPGR